MKAIEWKDGDRKRKHAEGDSRPAAGKGTQKQLKSPEKQSRQEHHQSRQEQQEKFYPAGSPGSLEKADGRRRHASEVEIGLLLKEDV